jgi:hypothetical protein
MNTALEYSTIVVQEGGRRCKKNTLNDLVHLTPLRIPLMNPPMVQEQTAAVCRFQHGANFDNRHVYQGQATGIYLS